MASPQNGSRTIELDRVIDVSADSPALLRSSNESIKSEDEEEDEEPLDEHSYHFGRHPIPMESPGEFLDINMDTITNDPILPRRRRRLFFSERITLRRRSTNKNKNGDPIEDTFWTGIMIANLFFFVIVSILVLYLTQTDFFESHQSALYGTTVDNRFTVISEEKANAKIVLKSGYSNARNSEAMIDFRQGQLHIGRYPSGHTDVQKFYGLSVFSNGSVSFTNQITVPLIKTDYLHASKSIVFEDGTLMTTAAKTSGGISEDGDLNLVSKTGSVSVSTGGKPALKVTNDGTVIIQSQLQNAEENPEEKGLRLDATTGTITIAKTFEIQHDENQTWIRTPHSLQLHTNHVIIGDIENNSSNVVITHATNDSQHSRLTLQGSTDVAVMGGDALKSGGNVYITGGRTNQTVEPTVYGDVYINALLPPSASSVTNIGTQNASHAVNIYGRVSLNSNQSSESTEPTTVIGGALLHVTSPNVTINTGHLNKSSVGVTSDAISLVASTTSNTSALLTLRGNNATLDATSHLFIGPQSPSICVGDKVSIDQGISLRSASHENGMVAIAGTKIQLFGGQDNGSDGYNDDDIADLAISHNNMTIDSDTLSIGSAGTTSVISFKGANVSVKGTTKSSQISITSPSCLIHSKSITIGDADVGSTMVLSGKSISIGNGEIQMGSVKTSKQVSIQGKTIELGNDAGTDHITIGQSSTETTLVGATINIGEEAKSMTIGSTDTMIRMKGKVTINDVAWDTHRLLYSKDDHMYGLLSVTSIQIPYNTAALEHTIRFETSESYVSNMATIHDEATNVRLQTNGGHIQMSLSLENVRVHVSSPIGEPKLQCRVYKIAAGVMDSPTVVMTVNLAMESCETEVECADPFFLGMTANRIVPYDKGDRFMVRCRVNSLPVPATVLIHRMQLDIITLG